MSAPAKIFFDLDGPILDVSMRHHRVYANTVYELEGLPLSCDEYWEAKRQKISDTEILSQSQVSPAVYATYQDRKLARIESEAYLSLDLVQVGALPLLQRLQGNYSLILVTLRNSRCLLEWQLKELQLESFFTHVLSGREAAKDGWRIKSALINGAYTDLISTDWIVGDTETDILAGQYLGIRTAAICNGIRTREHLQALNPTRLLSSVAQFSPTSFPHEDPIR